MPTFTPLQWKNAIDPQNRASFQTFMKQLADWANSAQQGLVKGGLMMVPPGAVFNFAGSTAPEGFLVADGSAVNRQSYQTLFLTIGTTYGPGDGINTFNLPNLRPTTSLLPLIKV